MFASQPAPEQPAAVHEAQDAIADCAVKLARYRAALDAGAGPGVVTGWVADAQAGRVRAEAELRRLTGAARMTREEIRTLIQGLASLRRVLREADPRVKAEVYRQLGLRPTYQPSNKTVRAEARLDAEPRGVMGRVRGGT